MKKITLLLIFFIANISFINAQKKSELIAEVSQLTSKLESTSNLLTESQRNERVNKNRAEDLQAKMDQLQKSNDGLMKNLSNLTELSQKNSSNVNNALKSLKQKELKLKTITSSISSNDSIALSTLTQVKQTMGEETQVGVTEGAIVLLEKKETLFGESEKAEITEAGKQFLKKLVDVLNASPNNTLTIESLGASVDLKSAALWSATITTVLQEEFKVNPSLIDISFAEAGFKDEIRFKLHLNYNQFYLKTREAMKN